MRNIPNRSFIKFIPATAWFAFLMVLLCLPGEDLPPVDDWIHKLYFDKWIHAGLFGIQAFLLIWPLGSRHFAKTGKTSTFVLIGAAVCLWGLATEFIQKYLVTGRNFDLVDWAADSIGSFLAVIFSVRYFRS